ncbi:hypothetical protein Pcac1_g4852 [Phytophthora cactorum]|nr:hypothetical protein Pcac1_g4852 [Phytophthora cactorum]
MVCAAMPLTILDLTFCGYLLAASLSPCRRGSHCVPLVMFPVMAGP